MVVIHSYSLAVIFCIVTMLCWGSWANTQKLATKSWPFQLYYWDFAIGILLISVILALTMGSYGIEGRPFIQDLQQASSMSLLYAFIGGVIFNLANILLVVSIDIAGMAVAFPVAIGLALVIGVIVNYIDIPLGNPIMLFAGVIFVAIAIILAAVASKRASKSTQTNTVKGIVIALIAGILMGFFYRFVIGSMSSDFATPMAGLMTPYSACVIFAVGIVISNLVFNSWMLKHPVHGEKLKFSDYFTQGSVWLHFIGILGGVIWGFGSTLNFIASDVAGSAISYGLGQGATLIAALWGVFIWKEFAGAPKGTNKLITIMFVLYVVGLTSIILARLV